MATDHLTGGRPWVLLPGTLCTGAVFDPFFDALQVPRAARSVIELRYPSVPEFADSLADATGPETIVCGFSLGAIVAAHLADRLRVSRIVLFGLNPHADDPAKRDGRLALARDVAERGGAAAMADRLPPLAGPDPETGRSHVLSMADEAAPLIGTQTSLALSRPGARAALARARCPVTLLTGTEDDQSPLRLAREAAAATPQGRTVPLDGLGHYALVEDPAACARALTDVWNSQ